MADFILIGKNTEPPFTIIHRGKKSGKEINREEN